MSFDHLEYNSKSGSYLIVEAGYKYEVPRELYNDFLSYVMRHDLVSRWYKQLNDADREKVQRVSAYMQN